SKCVQFLRPGACKGAVPPEHHAVRDRSTGIAHAAAVERPEDGTSLGVHRHHRSDAERQVTAEHDTICSAHRSLRTTADRILGCPKNRTSLSIQRSPPTGDGCAAILQLPGHGPRTAASKGGAAVRRSHEDGVAVASRAPLQTAGDTAGRGLGIPGKSAGLKIEGPEHAALLSGAHKPAAHQHRALRKIVVRAVLGRVAVGVRAVAVDTLWEKRGTRQEHEAWSGETAAYIPDILRQASRCPIDGAGVEWLSGLMQLDGGAALKRQLRTVGGTA